MMLNLLGSHHPRFDGLIHLNSSVLFPHQKHLQIVIHYTGDAESLDLSCVMCQVAHVKCQKQICNENVHISNLNLPLGAFWSLFKKKAKNGFSILFSKCDLTRVGFIFGRNFSEKAKLPKNA